MAEPIIRLVGEINEENVSEVIEQMGKLSRNNDKVSLLIDSDGGSIEEGFRLIDAIRILQNKSLTVHTVVTGKAYSMSCFIACAGNERTAYPNARFMLHCARYDGLPEGESYAADDLRVLLTEMEYYDKLMKDVLMLAGVPAEDAARLMNKRDTYFNTEEAMKLGIIQKEEYELV